MKCRRCGEEGAISPIQPVCVKCLASTTPVMEVGRPRLVKVWEGDGVKIYEPADSYLSKVRRP